MSSTVATVRSIDSALRRASSVKRYVESYRETGDPLAHEAPPDLR
jgi:hypothetical protein